MYFIYYYNELYTIHLNTKVYYLNNSLTVVIIIITKTKATIIKKIMYKKV